MIIFYKYRIIIKKELSFSSVMSYLLCLISLWFLFGFTNAILVIAFLQCLRHRNLLSLCFKFFRFLIIPIDLEFLLAALPIVLPIVDLDTIKGLEPDRQEAIRSRSHIYDRMFDDFYVKTSCESDRLKWYREWLLSDKFIDKFKVDQEYKGKHYECLHFLISPS
jgi:hypothetical protein